jgi:hypothetical protein
VRTVSRCVQVLVIGIPVVDPRQESVRGALGPTASVRASFVGRGIVVNREGALRRAGLQLL